MANRNIDKFLLKKSGVVGKIPTQLDLGELAINFADGILYASGTTANSILPIGWDRIYRSGDTMTGTLKGPIFSATTYLNLPTDIRVTGGTYSAGTAVFTNNTGGTFNVSGFVSSDTYVTGFTYSNNNFTINQNQGQASLNVLVNTMTGLTINGNLDFSTGNTIPTNSSGRVFYNSIEQALAYYPNANQDVIVNIGQQQYIRVNNSSGSLITKGSVVNAVSASGGTPSITLAISTGLTGNNIIGLAAHNIAVNSQGLVLTNGLLYGLTINTFNVGDNIYLSDTIAGGYINDTSSLAIGSRINQIGYITATGTSTGQIFVDITNENSNELLTIKQKNLLVTDSISTGVYSFTGIAKTSSTTFSIAPVSGWIIKNTNEYSLSGNVTNIQYSGSTGMTTPFLATHDNTHILISTANTVTLQSTHPTPQQRRDNIFLGLILHPNRTSIDFVLNTPDNGVSPISQLRDMFVPIKLINDGIIASSNGANLTFKTSSGSLYGLGINWVTDTLNPDSVVITASTPTTFAYRTQTGGTFSNTTLISAATYDVNGVATALPGGGNTTTNQRLYLYPNGEYRIQFGQTIYTSLANAIAGLDTETFVVFPDLFNNAILIGIITVRKGATDLSDPADAKISFTSKFGEVFAGSGGLSTTTLQQAYNNSVTPEIVINSTLDGVSIKNGTGNADNVTNLLEGINTNGFITSFIKANGGFSATTITATSVSATTYLNLPTDIYVTGFTYDNANNYSITKNNGQILTVNANIMTGLTINGNLNVTNSISTPSIVGNLTGATGLTITTSTTAATNITRGINFIPTLVASANNDSLIGLDINPTFTNGAFTNVSNIGLRVKGSIIPSVGSTYELGSSSILWFRVNATELRSNKIRLNSGDFILNDSTDTSTFLKIFNSTGNVVIQSGGTYVDAGYRLDVSGATRIQNNLTVSGAVSAMTVSATTYLNLPTDVRITGGTPNNSAKTYTFTNNTGGTFSVIGLTDLTITGGTYSAGTAVFTNNTGGTFSITGFTTGGTSGTDTYVTGGTYTNATGTAVFRNNTGGTFSVTGFTTGSTCGTLREKNVVTTTGNSSTLLGSITGFSSGTYIVESYITANKSNTEYGVWKRTIGVTTTGNTPVIVYESDDLDKVSDGFSGNAITYSAISGNVINIYVVGISANTFNWTSYYEIIDEGIATSCNNNTYLSSGSTAAISLSNTSNWSPVGVYTGTTITSTYQGQKFYDLNYFYEAVDNNLWIRLIRG